MSGQVVGGAVDYLCGLNKKEQTFEVALLLYKWKNK